MDYFSAFFSPSLPPNCGRLDRIARDVSLPIERKSVEMVDREIYSIIPDLVKELYLHSELREEKSHLTFSKLSFRDKTFIKHLAVYLCHVVLGHSMRRIARGFGYERTSVSYACRNIEDKREDVRCEMFVATCERLIGIIIKR